MGQPEITYQITLAGLRATTARDMAVVIPWTELRGPHAGLAPSALMRYLHPWLPASIHALASCGAQAINRLRIRAATRALRRGQLERFWVSGQPIDLPRLALCIFGAVLVFSGVLAVGMPFGRVAAGPLGEVEYEALISAFRRNAGIAILLLGGALPAVLWLIACIRGRRPRILAVRTRADDVELHYDDGRIVSRDWGSFLAEFRPQRLSGTAQDLQRPIVLGAAVAHDWRILMRAAERRLGTRPSKPYSRRADLRTGRIVQVLFPLLMMGLVAACGLLRDEDRLRARGSGPPGPLASSLLVAGLGVFLFFFTRVCLDPVARHPLVAHAPLVETTTGANGRGHPRPLMTFVTRNYFG